MTGDQVAATGYGEDANGITSQRAAAMRRAVASLEKVRSEIQAENPDKSVVWFLDGSNELCLMVEPVDQAEHDSADIAMSLHLPYASGGDW